ncbi:MAG: transcriptional repressor [Acidimicrobiales bacterium]
MATKAKSLATDDAVLLQVLARLREEGKRITEPRILILRHLVDSAHISAEQLCDGVRLASPDVAESTIYRTLAALEEMGILHHVHFGHGPAVWHLSDDQRGHLVCTKCGSVAHVAVGDTQAVARRMMKSYGFCIDAHFAYIGLCSSCHRR